MGSCSIVVVDDDAITQELIAVTLEDRLGAQVHSFTQSKVARDFLMRQDDTSLSLIISDQMMPDYDGISLLKMCRKQGMQLPFLLLTADATRETVLEARRSGATQFVAKPFKVDDLIAKVNEILAG
ncbi:response regulator [Salinimonas marina]|uniref:Response regulator n=1 Tax=Salinimonas marina TaxID=2785918 RepID=A0A7S9HDR2_9ALTE|nr:response regulator [Salinimonas marina]QPG06202.1 response regulator [Salinimonas marina]